MKSTITKLFNNEFLKGGIILTVSSVAVNFFNYIFNFLVGRSLGPSGYGEIATLFSYITLLSIPTSILTTIIIQKIGATDQEKISYSHSIEAYVNQKIKRYIPFMVLALVIVPFLPRITNLSPLSSLVLIPLIALSILISIYNSIFQGLKLFFLISWITLVITFLKMLGSVAVAVHLGQIQVVEIFLLLSSLVGYFISIYYFKKTTSKSSFIPENRVEKRMLHFLTSPQFIITGLSIAAVTALNNVDVIYVKKFFSAKEAGLYSSWSLFAKAIFYVLGPLLSVSFVFFAHSKNEKDQKKSFLLSLAALAVLGSISYFFYTFFATTIITTLFGTKFAPIIPFLGLASIYGSLYTILTFINNYFLARKSKLALILPITLPIYVAAFFLVDKELPNLFLVNNIYSFSLVLIYITAFFISGK